ncbi:hypothetical protein V6N11_057593 [Hibiscus sabdariffa]
MVVDILINFHGSRLDGKGFRQKYILERKTALAPVSEHGGSIRSNPDHLKAGPQSLRCKSSGCRSAGKARHPFIMSCHEVDRNTFPPEPSTSTNATKIVLRLTSIPNDQRDPVDIDPWSQGTEATRYLFKLCAVGNISPVVYDQRDCNL